MANIFIPSRKAPLPVRLVKGAANLVFGVTVCAVALAVPVALLYLTVKVIRLAWGG